MRRDKRREERERERETLLLSSYRDAQIGVSAVATLARPNPTANVIVAPNRVAR